MRSFTVALAAAAAGTAAGFTLAPSSGLTRGLHARRALNTRRMSERSLVDVSGTNIDLTDSLRE